jgi:uracil-DNA glycosylase family 4
MGFTYGLFYRQENIEALRAATKTARAPRQKVPTDYRNAARGCDVCSLKATWPTLTTPCMKISGAKKADTLLLGESPGASEDQQGRAFVGRSGELLRQYIPSKFQNRVAFSNLVKCHPDKNRNPTPQEANACSIHLEEEIQNNNFKVIVGLGGVPLNYFFQEEGISRIYGTRFPIEIAGKTLWYFPTFHPAYILHTEKERASPRPIFVNDLKYVFDNIDDWEPPIIERPNPKDVICVYDKETAYNLYNRLNKDLIGIDFEAHKFTKPYEYGFHLLTAAFSDGNLTFGFSVDHPEQKNDWAIDLILKIAGEHRWIGHNCHFELPILLHLARTVKKLDNWRPHRFEDSMAIGRVYHQRESLGSLETQTRIHLGVNIKKLTNVDPANLINYPLSEVLPYNGLDSWGSVKLFNVLRKQVDDYNYDHIIGAIQSTVEMEFMGLPIDREAALELKQIWHAKRKNIEAEARNINEVKEFERERQKEFNLGSNKDVGTILVTHYKIDLPKTKSGDYSTDDSILSKHIDNPLVKCRLDYQKAVKHESTYIDPALRVPDRYPDNMLHPAYKTMNVATGRLSSVDPNIQNQPSRKHRELRRIVHAVSKHIILACDEGQLEVRILAMDSKDKNLIKSIIAKEDIHRYWVDRLLDFYYPVYIDRLMYMTNEKDEAKLRKAGRTVMKSDFVFASFYGATAKNCSERTGIPIHIVEAMLEELWGKFPDVLKWIKTRRAAYNNQGRAWSLTGLVRYGIMSGNEPQNFPIQCAAAHLVVDAQNELSEMAFANNDLYLHPRINIHDDLTLIIPDDDDKIEYYLKIITQTMTKIRFPWQCVPLMIEAKIGYNWSDMEEIGTFEGDYVKPDEPPLPRSKQYNYNEKLAKAA